MYKQLVIFFKNFIGFRWMNFKEQRISLWKKYKTKEKKMEQNRKKSFLRALFALALSSYCSKYWGVRSPGRHKTFCSLCILFHEQNFREQMSCTCLTRSCKLDKNFNLAPVLCKLHLVLYINHKHSIYAVLIALHITQLSFKLAWTRLRDHLNLWS